MQGFFITIFIWNIAMNLINYNTVFCDWLDVTYSPEEDIIPELIPFLVSADFITADNAPDLRQSYYPIGDSYGNITIDIRQTFVRVSASGGAISFLRSKGRYEEYLALLSTAPHTVTRLDLAYDIGKDFPSILHGFKIHYPDGKASFTRKLSPVREYLSMRSDGLMSGTYYIGKPRSMISGRVYDKTLEMLEKRKLVIPVCTRYEITFRKCSTLKDALDCEPLFWQYSEVLKLQHLKPKNVPEWVDGSDFTGWDYQRTEFTDYQKLQRSVETSGCIGDLITKADDLGSDGRKILLRLLTKRIIGTS